VTTSEVWEYDPEELTKAVNRWHGANPPQEDRELVDAAIRFLVNGDPTELGEPEAPDNPGDRFIFAVDGTSTNVVIAYLVGRTEHRIYVAYIGPSRGATLF
jgi:hypothetical protein